MGPTLRLVAIPVAASALGACDGCAHVPEPPAGTSPVSAAIAPADATAPRVAATTPHDPRAFTQGLVRAGGVFYESTGGYGASSVRRVDPATGEVARRTALPREVFGEGLALLGDELFQLTWKEGRCFVYDAETLTLRRELPYEGEGWGLAGDGAGGLVMSDGSDALRFLDPKTLRPRRTIHVREGARPIDRLNELEWARGEILANVWGEGFLARIDPETGQVVGRIDLSSLPEPHHADPDAVLNGIAYDAAGDRLFVTGKLWGSVYEIAPPWR